jgi:hypothetical protein
MPQSLAKILIHLIYSCRASLSQGFASLRLWAVLLSRPWRYRRPKCVRPDCSMKIID